MGLVDLDKELVDKIKGLKLEFKDEPQPELLIRLPNRDKDVGYELEVKTSEFTSLCPLNLTQPDYATLIIRYKPKDWIVELKSLKFYLVSFRQVPVFHEQVPATILKALVDLLGPRELIVAGLFAVRGGLATTISAVFKEEVEEGD